MYKSHKSKGFLAFTAQHLKRYNCEMKSVSSWVCRYRYKSLLTQIAVLITLQYEPEKPLQFEFPMSKLPLLDTWKGKIGKLGFFRVISLMD